MTEFLKPSFVIAFVMLLGAAVLCWHGKVSEAGYLTVTLAVGAGFGLSTQAGQIVKELRK
ncbi:hypothetical protein ACFSF0_04550 [Ottowia flava]|uniref:TMhelix containing protein n=1 Tax=Ottowia flava TaxID=2675430 RepID=A0ABW4KQU1_9BURK